MEDTIEKDTIFDENTELLQEPDSPNDMLAKVREMFDKNEVSAR